MTIAFRQKVTVKPGGVIEFRTPQLPAGSQAEVIVLSEAIIGEESQAAACDMTAADLLASDLIGMWKVRSDIPDSLEYARQLREQSEHRDAYKP